jgi:hypothetical protein
VSAPFGPSLIVPATFSGRLRAPVGPNSLTATGARFFFPQNNNVAGAGSESSLSHLFFVTSPFPGSDLRFCFDNSWIASDSSGSPERAGSNPLTIDFATVFVGGTPYPVSFGGAGSITLQPNDYIWATVPTLTSIPADTFGFIRVSCTVATNAFRPAGYRPQTSQILGEAVEYTATPQAAKATSGTVSGVGSGANVRCYGPCMAVMSGWDGRPVPIIVGDSIGEGAADGIISTDARGIVGYIPRGLDDNASTRMSFCMLAAAGTAPSQSTGLIAGNFKHRYDIISALPNMPGTCVLSQHGVNEMGLLAGPTDEAGFETVMSNWWRFLRQVFPGYKLIQTTLSPRVQTAANNSNWTNQVDQQPSAVDTNPTGARWTGNAYIRGKPAPVDALIDVTHSFQDPTNLDHWQTSALSWTLNTAVIVNGTTISVAGASRPPEGDVFVLEPGTTNVEAFTMSAAGWAGTGPWTATLGPGGKYGKAHSIGVTIKLSLVSDGTHPTHMLHAQAAQDVIAAKQAGVFV